MRKLYPDTSVKAFPINLSTIRCEKEVMEIEIGGCERSSGVCLPRRKDLCSLLRRLASHAAGKKCEWRL